jgi:hypothetical protein
MNMLYYIHTNTFHRSIIHSRWHEYEIGHKEDRERKKRKKRKKRKMI